MLVVNEQGTQLDDLGFTSIDDAESALYKAFSSELDTKLTQVKILLAIQEKQLYRQKLDDDGEPYPNFYSYLKGITPQLNAIGAGKFRSLQSWMSKYKILVRELGLPESTLRELGSHVEALLPAASRTAITGTLKDEDEPTETGKKLGKENFAALVEEIRKRVECSRSGIPEESWTVHDTVETVREITGRQSNKPKKVFRAHWVGTDKVKLDSLSFWINDSVYQVGDIIPIEHFKLIAKNSDVDGLGEEWR